MFEEIPWTLDSKEHAFYRKWREQGCPLHGPAWRYHAARLVAHAEWGAELPYIPEEESWAWSNEMLEEMSAFMGPDWSRISVDPDGPGFGVHVFERIRKITAYVYESNSYRWRRMSLDTVDDGIQFIQVVRVCQNDTQVTSYSPQESLRFDWNVSIGEKIAGLKRVEKIYHNEPVIWNWFKLVQCLLKSRAFDVQKESVPDRIRRQGRRKLGIDLDTQVRVVNWRKVPRSKVGATGDEAERDKHWWVSGHTREQWYPSKGKHYLKYIEPHVKGNMDAPLHRPVKVNYVRQ